MEQWSDTCIQTQCSNTPILQHSISLLQGPAALRAYISFRSRHFSQMRLHSASASLTASSGLSTPWAALANLTLRIHFW